MFEFLRILIHFFDSNNIRSMLSGSVAMSLYTQPPIYKRLRFCSSLCGVTDTPGYIRNLQLKMWLAKPPEERLLQFIMENDAWWPALQDTKENLNAKNFQNKQNK